MSKYHNHKELEFSEFVVAPASTQTTINRITFEHALKQSGASNNKQNTNIDSKITSSLNQNSKMSTRSKK